MSYLSASIKSSDEVLASLSATCRDLLGDVHAEDTHPAISECAHSLTTSFLEWNKDQRVEWKWSLVNGTDDYMPLVHELKELQKSFPGNTLIATATVQAEDLARALRGEIRSDKAEAARYALYTDREYPTSQAAAGDLFHLTSEAVEALPSGALSANQDQIAALFSFVKPEEEEAWENLKSSMATGFPCIDNTATSIRERLAAAKNAQDLEGADVHPCVSAAISVAEKFERLWRAEH